MPTLLETCSTYVIALLLSAASIAVFVLRLKFGKVRK